MLTSNYLISPTHSQNSLFISGPEHSLSVYFHLTSDPVYVASGTQYSQRITPLEFPNSLLDHALSLFDRISAVANVSFQQVYQHTDADISFFFDSEANLITIFYYNARPYIKSLRSNNRQKFIEIF